MSSLPPGFVLDPPTGLPPGFVLDPPPNNVTGADPSDQNPRVPYPAPQAAPSVGRRLGIGAQGVGAGVADVVGGPVDIVSGLMNLVSRGLNAAGEMAGYDPGIPQIKEPFLGSDFIRNKTAAGAEAVGVPVIDPAAMSPNEKLGYDINRYGTQALSLAGPLAVAAPAREAAIAAGGAKSNIGDAFLRPYQGGGATRAVVGDAAAGVGAGVATNAAETMLPDKREDTPWTNAGVDLARGMAPIVGGVGGATLASVGEGGARMIGDAFTKGRPDKRIPLDPANPTAKPATKGEVEKASRVMQDVASDPGMAARNIRENADTNRANGMPQPTVGLVSGDVGLQSAESAARTKNGVPFIENDNKLRVAATDKVNSLRDPGADQTQPAKVAKTEAALRTNQTAGEVRNDVRRVEAESGAQVATARVGTATAEEGVRTADAFMQQQAAPIAARANSEAKGAASRRLDATVVDGGYVPARTEKNRQFDTAPGRTEQVPADPVFAAVDDVLARNNALRPDAQLPQDLVTRLNALRPQMEDQASRVLGPDGQPVSRQVNVGGTGTAAGGDLADTRKYLSAAYERAQKAGNFDMADSIATLRRSINETISQAPGYAEANANYTQFAERYRPSPNDEAAKFTREIDRDPGRGSTPPTETAGRFLAGPEKTQALQRMLDGSSLGDGHVRDYLRSDFGMSALNANGTLNPQRAAAWARNNADTLAQFPRVRAEFDDMVATARRGEQLSQTAQRNLKAAQGNLGTAEQTAAGNVRSAERAGEKRMRATEQEIDRSAAGTLLKEDPRDTARRIFGSPSYAAEKELAGIKKVIGADAQANRGWKAAVSEYLSDNLSGTTKLDSGKAATSDTTRVELSKLDKMFKQNEKLLAEVYSPKEMSTLRQAHAALEPLKNASVKATSGSNTADKGEQMWRMAEAGLKAKYGMLKGGGIVRTMRLVASTLPDDSSAIQRIVERAWFDPDIAEYLLTKKVRDMDAATSNAHIRRLMGGAAYGRSSSEDE